MATVVARESALFVPVVHFHECCVQDVGARFSERGYFGRTVARKFSIGGLSVCVGGLTF